MPAGFDPLVSEWFHTRFAGLTEPQARGWPLIRAGVNVLVSAPTGSGKTLAAFLICLDGLVKAARCGALPDATQVVYISPLKALSNDIRTNLEIPLSEIAQLAADKGIELQPIRADVRTGDTTAWQRRQMIEQPPHILVTTPESLFILMTTEKGRRMLSTARTVIVDEIHALAGNKRGSHLALTLARLEALVALERRPPGRPVGEEAMEPEKPPEGGAPRGGAPEGGAPRGGAPAPAHRIIRHRQAGRGGRALSGGRRADRRHRASP